MKTLIGLLYRDGSNYKFSTDFIVEGEVDDEAVAAFLEEGEDLLVGPIRDRGIAIPDPHDVAWRTHRKNDDDHVWVSYDGSMPYEGGRAPLCTTEQFLSVLKACHESDWQDYVLQETDRLDLNE